MQNYKNVCGKHERVWFEIKPEEGEQFLTWAKGLGLAWLNGQKIKPGEGVSFFHFSVRKDGKLTNVPYFIWTAKQFEQVPKYSFYEYLKGN